MNLLTEQSSPHRYIDRMPIEKVTSLINQEDKKVAEAVERSLPQINNLISAIVGKLTNGRLFYVGAGSGGRLSVLDAIELPTTYGVSRDLVNVILAGGVERLTDALEEKEDDTNEGWSMLRERNVSADDIVVGISASGTTPFVLSALSSCRNNKIVTGCIVSNPGSPVAGQSDFPVEVITGPEFITGSTRMKCGTAQKMILDVISTTVMVMLGRVEGNSMVNVKLINAKIIDRGVRMLMERTGLRNYEEAREILMRQGSVRKAIEQYGS